MDYLDNLKLNDMKCGMFNNKSYWGKKSNELKSGVCKYFRREVYDKFEWCIIEMMIFGLKKKGFMTNILNRLKILIFEEIVISEMDKIVELINIINKIDLCNSWDDKVKNILNFIKIANDCKKGRICSYMNNWWKYNTIIYKSKIKLNKVLKYKKKNDDEKLLILGELLIKYIDRRDEKIIDIFNKMYKLDDKFGSRFRRNNGIYLYWEIIQDKFNDNHKFMTIFNFCLNTFFNKNMKERPYFGIWIGMFIINYEKIIWDKDIIFKKNNINLKLYFEDRNDIQIDDYVVNDYHVNKKYGLDIFATEGAYVKNEYLSDLKNGERYKDFYIQKKKEIPSKHNNKNIKKKELNKKNLQLEIIDFNKFNIIKVIEEGVCSLKKCCIIIEYMNKKYVLKEFSKNQNWGKDYEMLDKVKYLFNIKNLDIVRIESNKSLERIDKNKRTYKDNWKFENRKTIYCMMNFFENIGDIGSNKNLLNKSFKEQDLLFKELIKIRLFDGLFRSSDNIMRNILVNESNQLLSIDEGDIFGKRKNIFNKNDWCIKNMNYKILDDCINEFIKNIDQNIDIITDNLIEFGFEDKVNEFQYRYKNYKEIVYSELK